MVDCDCGHMTRPCDRNGHYAIHMISGFNALRHNLIYDMYPFFSDK
jgi:hypothetical protein